MPLDLIHPEKADLRLGWARWSRRGPKDRRQRVGITSPKRKRGKRPFRQSVPVPCWRVGLVERPRAGHIRSASAICRNGARNFSACLRQCRLRRVGEVVEDRLNRPGALGTKSVGDVRRGAETNATAPGPTGPLPWKQPTEEGRFIHE